MPNGDRTGPEGKGPKTGRGLGYCAGNKQAGRNSDAPRQGQGRGLRNGSGRRLGNGLGRGQRKGFGRRFQELEE